MIISDLKGGSLAVGSFLEWREVVYGQWDGTTATPYAFF